MRTVLGRSRSKSLFTALVIVCVGVGAFLGTKASQRPRYGFLADAHRLSKSVVAKINRNHPATDSEAVEVYELERPLDTVKKEAASELGPSCCDSGGQIGADQNEYSDLQTHSLVFFRRGRISTVSRGNRFEWTLFETDGDSHWTTVVVARDSSKAGT